MKKKFNEWLDAPFTWRRYFKMVGVSYIIVIVWYIWYMFHIGLVTVDGCKTWVKQLFNKNGKEDED